MKLSNARSMKSIDQQRAINFNLALVAFDLKVRMHLAHYILT